MKRKYCISAYTDHPWSDFLEYIFPAKSSVYRRCTRRWDADDDQADIDILTAKRDEDKWCEISTGYYGVHRNFWSTSKASMCRAEGERNWLRGI